MNIKSNSKKQGPGVLKSAWSRFKETLPGYGLGMKSLVLVASITIAAGVWQYSGMFSVFSVMVGLILIAQDDHNNIGVVEKSMFIFFSIIVVFIFGSMNVYHTTPAPITIKYSKLTFTDSTEKLIIFMTYPEVKTINQPLSTTEYYTLKEQQDNIEMTIGESGEYDHWDMLLHKKDKAFDIEEYTYSFTIKAGGKTIENKYWWKTKTQQFVQKTKGDKS